MLPNFLCVGFPRCSTTTLHEMLLQNKEIYLPEIKETLFFSREEEYQKGLSFYKKHWYPRQRMKRNKNVKMVGGIEPSFYSDITARRISRAFPKDLKLIFIMRNPVDAAFSYYRLMLRNGNRIYGNMKNMQLNEYFDKYILDEHYTNSNDIQIYNYAKCIKNYMKYFSKDNMLFLLAEDLNDHPKEAMRTIYEFLGVSSTDCVDLCHVNAANLVPKNTLCSIANYLLCRLDHFCCKHNRYHLASEIRHNKTKYLCKECNSKLLPETRAKLERYYSRSVRELESILDRDLSNIWFDAGKTKGSRRI